MIYEMLIGFLGCATGIEGVVVYIFYRKNQVLAETAVEFAGMVVQAIKEEVENLSVDPVSLSALALDHASHLTGLLKRWF